MKKYIFFLISIWLIANQAYSQHDSQFEVLVHKDIRYVADNQVQNDSLQRLSLVMPQGITSCPLLIWIGGGAWSYGDRNMELDFARRVARSGIAVASIGHRLSPATWRDSSLNTGIQHPMHILDVASSVKWLYDHAGEYGYDPDNFFIGGYSSGGHLSALISMDSTYLAGHQLSNQIFKGVIPISGTYDIPDYYRAMLESGRPELAKLHVMAVFGEDSARFPMASPIHFMDGLKTPMLLMSDNNMYNYTRLFEEKIRETDFREVEVVYAYNLNHGGLWRNLSFEEHSLYRNIIVDFIETQSKSGT